MRRALLICFSALLSLLTMAMADGRLTAVSQGSPLAGRCDANDRTLLYGEASHIEEEAVVAVHPGHPDEIAVAWTQDLGLGIVVASSSDGGRRWSHTVVPGLTACTAGQADRVVHPRLSFGPDGTLYPLTSPLDGFFPDPRSSVAGLAVSTSTDGGRTWSMPSMLNASPAMNDLGGISAEPDVPGAAVVVWSHPEIAADAMQLSRTTDGGRTWVTRPVGAPRLADVSGKTILAHPNGDLLVVLREEPLDAFVGLPVRQRPISVYRSDDKGLTWDAPITLTPDSAAYFWPLVAAASDGDTYVVWGTAAGDGRLALAVRRSRDGGLTWDPAVPVATVDAFDLVQMQPSLAAGPGGTVALAHYARTAEGDLAVMLTRSSDGGGTWTPEVLAGPFAEGHVTNPWTGESGVTYQLGLSASDGRLTAGFVATGDLARIGASDVYTTSIRIPRGAGRGAGR